MNVLSFMYHVAAGNILAAVNVLRENAVHTGRVFWASLVPPILLLFVGIGFGMLGNALEISALITVARLILCVGGCISILLMAWVWIRMAVLLKVMVAVTTAGHGLIEKVPKLEDERAEAFIQWLRGLTAWLAGVFLYAMVVPVWNNIVASMIVMACMGVMAAAMSAKWFAGALFRRIFVVVTFAIFIAATGMLVFPRSADTFQQSVNAYMEDASGWSKSHREMREVERKAIQQRSAIGVGMVGDLRAQQNIILQRYRSCGGKFCSDTDRVAYSVLEKRIAQIKNGNFGVQAEPSPAPTQRKKTRGLPRLSKKEADWIFEGLDD